MRRPIANSYVVPGTRFAAGEYPGSPPHADDAARDAKLTAFLDAGISVFVDLTDPADRLAPYHEPLARLAADRGMEVLHVALPITDMSVCAPERMERVLVVVDEHLAAGRGVYVHCWGGVGRTGMSVGCWLVRNGRSGDQAIAEVRELLETMSASKVSRHRAWGSPQTDAQRAFVREWSRHCRPGGSAVPGPGRRERCVGALLGLAAGDALGTTVEFKRRGTFTPVTDIVGGGPFSLKPGQWTDDTSMAMCLAESLLECGGFDAEDQLRRYLRWYDEGHWSSTGRLFDIGITTRHALETFRVSSSTYGPSAENTAGNGSLMRLAPVPMFFAGNPAAAIEKSGLSSRTTHASHAAVSACRYFGGLVVGALNGASKEQLLSPLWSPVNGEWKRGELHPAIEKVALGSFQTKDTAAIRGSGYVVDCLEAALWAFTTTTDFRSGALAAVNLGDDADTTGAVYGQIAGAYYGVEGIPRGWREKIAMRGEIESIAERLAESQAVGLARSRSEQNPGGV